MTDAEAQNVSMQLVNNGYVEWLSDKAHGMCYDRFKASSADQNELMQVKMMQQAIDLICSVISSPPQ